MTSLPSAAPQVLVVDDDRSVREILTEELRVFGYEVEQADSAMAAREKFGAGGRFDLVLCDIDMPGEPGTELLAWIKKTDPDVAVIMVTGINVATIAVSAMLKGASDYVCKPFSLAEVRARTEQALEKRRLVLENRSYQLHLERLVDERTHEVLKAMAEIRNLNEDLKAAYDATLAAMLSALDKRDNETQGHSLRVVEYTTRLACEMGIKDPELTDIRRGALLHDVGKIGIPDAILRKPGKLNVPEWEVMKRHPELGFEMLRDINFLRIPAQIVLTHQEKYDGSGYPQGLRAEQIPIGSRIFAAADALDAMTSNRPYRQALAYEKVRRELIDNCGTQFDPMVVEAFLRVPADEWSEIRERVTRRLKTGSVEIVTGAF